MILTTASFNLLVNGGLEAGDVGSWQEYGPSSLYVSADSKFSGDYGGVLYPPISTVDVHGIYQDELNEIWLNRTYYSSVCLRVSSAYEYYRLRLCAEGEDYVITDVASFYPARTQWNVYRYCFRPQSMESDAWNVKGMFDVRMAGTDYLSILYFDDCRLQEAVALKPNYNSRIYTVIPELLAQRNVRNQFVAYRVGSSHYGRYEIECDFVSAADRALISSWWRNGLDLLLWTDAWDDQTLTLTTSGTLVRIVSEDEPFADRIKDRRGYYAGKLLLETLANV